MIFDAVHEWIKLKKELPQLFAESYYKDKFAKGTPAFAIAACMIHPIYRGADLSNEMKKDGRDWISTQDKNFLPLTLNLACKDESIFSPCLFEESVLADVSPINWWLTAQQDNPTKISDEFIKMCRILLELPASSAGLERIFSAMTNTITDKRNRLGVEKARKITFINQALKNT
ncbi:uncharacterized protein LOC118437710 [Folsomia candida]|nr:uncharacterized protein LOC118437710 [Folsomia candida]